MTMLSPTKWNKLTDSFWEITGPIPSVILNKFSIKSPSNSTMSRNSPPLVSTTFQYVFEIKSVGERRCESFENNKLLHVTWVKGMIRPLDMPLA
jgi:hypothetical protein